MNIKRLAISLLIGAALAAASGMWARDFPAGLLRVQGGVPMPFRSLESDIHIHDTYYVFGWSLIANFTAFTAITFFVLSRSRRRKGGKIMANVIPEVTTDVLQAYADAWNRHDVDAVMSFMTEDCVFEASAGPDICGTRYAGHEAVRAGFAEVWTTFSDAHWGSARHFVQGERGVSEWTFTGTRADGTRVEVHGCDLFTFRDGKIALKNSYRKNRPPAAARDR